MSRDTSSFVVLDEEVLRQVRDEAAGIGLPNLIETFTSEIVSRHQRIAAALGRNDLERAEYEAHTLSGTSGTFGAMRLQAIALQLEHHCHAGDLNGAHGLTGQLTDAMEEACAAFRAFADTNPH